MMIKNWLMIATMVMSVIGLSSYSLAQNETSAPIVDVEEVLPSKEEILTIQPNDLVIGDVNAPVTIIEYASLSCSHCASFHADSYDMIKKNYIDTGKVKFVFRDFPLDEPALRGSMLARCADDSKFEKFIDVLFSTQDNWSRKKNYLEILSNIAKLGGMPGEAFDACMVDTSVEESVINSKLHALKVLEVRSTPTFFINEEKHEGAKNSEYFKKVIDGLLSSDVKDEIS